MDDALLQAMKERGMANMQKQAGQASPTGQQKQAMKQPNDEHTMILKVLIDRFKKTAPEGNDKE